MSGQLKRYAIRRLSYFGHLVAAIAIAVFALVILFLPESPTAEKASVWILVLFVVIALYGAYMFIAMPQYIDVAPDGTLSFRSYLGTRVASPAELTQVATETMGYYVVFRFGAVDIKLLNRVDGLHELLSSLKAQKPDLMIIGL